MAIERCLTTTPHQYNESTTGADASVEALKLYHMKLTLAYSSLLAREYKKWEMIAVIVAKKSSKSTNGRARLAVMTAERTYS